MPSNARYRTIYLFDSDYGSEHPYYDLALEVITVTVVFVLAMATDLMLTLLWIMLMLLNTLIAIIPDIFTCLSAFLIIFLVCDVFLLLNTFEFVTGYLVLLLPTYLSVFARIVYHLYNPVEATNYVNLDQ